jgi:ankyrin repeat protein
VTDGDDPRAAFLEAAVWHGSLERAEAILAVHPEVADGDVHVAAVLGDDAAVRRFLALDPGTATAKAGPYGADALTSLCLSKYLRLDRSRTDGFLRAATALLDAGADPNTGFWTRGEHPEFETALYGAAGVAHHPELTRLLLERGADPNDEEVPYHAPETRDNAALKVLVESGQLTADSLATMLLRKADWHDYDGIKYLLEHGADPNRMTRWHHTALHQALRRDNALRNVEVLLDHGADPTLGNLWDGKSAVSIAAREGRSDVLELFEQRGIPVELHGVERLLAACARDDAAGVRSVVNNEPHLVSEVLAMGGELLAKFAGTGNVDGVRQLLDLGVDVRAPYAPGDGYFGIAKDSLAIHVAAWRAQPAIVRLLIERGSPIDVPDGNGRTPLTLAVRACVDSYWTEMRSPESVAALLEAGASASGVAYPSGYAEVDELLRRHGRMGSGSDNA